MSETLETLKRQALSLSREERDELIGVLIADLDGPGAVDQDAIMHAWELEVADRLAAIGGGDAKWVPADEVFAVLETIVRDGR